VIDTSDIDWMLKYGADHGWYRPFAYDHVHFQYRSSHDKKRPPKVKPTDTRKVYLIPKHGTIVGGKKVTARNRWYIAGLVDGVSKLNDTTSRTQAIKWIASVGRGTPYKTDLATIQAKATPRVSMHVDDPQPPMKPQDTTNFLLGGMQKQLEQIALTQKEDRTGQESFRNEIRDSIADVKTIQAKQGSDIEVLKAKQVPKTPWYSITAGIAGILGGGGGLIALLKVLNP
jgi:hypothetical protein